MISPTQTPLPDKTQHSQQADVHAAGEIQTHGLSRWQPKPQTHVLHRAATETDQTTHHGLKCTNYNPSSAVQWRFWCCCWVMTPCCQKFGRACCLHPQEIYGICESLKSNPQGCVVHYEVVWIVSATFRDALTGVLTGARASSRNGEDGKNSNLTGMEGGGIVSVFVIKHLWRRLNGTQIQGSNSCLLLLVLHVHFSWIIWEGGFGGITLCEVKWTKQSEVEWGEVNCSIVKERGEGNESLLKRFIGVVSDEKWRTGVKAWAN